MLSSIMGMTSFMAVCVPVEASGDMMVTQGRLGVALAKCLQMRAPNV